MGLTQYNQIHKSICGCGTGGTGRSRRRINRPIEYSDERGPHENHPSGNLLEVLPLSSHVKKKLALRARPLSRHLPPCLSPFDALRFDFRLRASIFLWWPLGDSNPQLDGYEPPALTIELRGHIYCFIGIQPTNKTTGDSGGTRTHNLRLLGVGIPTI